MMNKLAEYGMAEVTQVNEDEDDCMPKSYKEYKEKIDQEERLEFDSYQHELDSQEYIYESDYVSDNEVVGKDDNDDDECMIEVKDPDLDDQRNISSHHNGICLMQTDRSATGLNLRNCVLLDSESTVHAFCNSNLLEDIWAQEEVMTLVGNGGTMTTNQMATIRNLDTKDPVWYHPEYITNILSLAKVKEQYRITYDSDKGGVFEVHIPGKSSLYFPCYNNGLHILECSNEGFSFVETIAENKKGYSKRQIHNADRVGAFIETIGNPSERDLRTLVRSGAILNLSLIHI